MSWRAVPSLFLPLRPAVWLVIGPTVHMNGGASRARMGLAAGRNGRVNITRQSHRASGSKHPCGRERGEQLRHHFPPMLPPWNLTGADGDCSAKRWCRGATWAHSRCRVTLPSMAKGERNDSIRLAALSAALDRLIVAEAWNAKRGTKRPAAVLANDWLRHQRGNAVASPALSRLPPGL